MRQIIKSLLLASLIALTAGWSAVDDSDSYEDTSSPCEECEEELLNNGLCDDYCTEEIQALKKENKKLKRELQKIKTFGNVLKSDDLNQINEATRRIMLREALKKFNSHLSSLAKKAGIKTPEDFKTFYNSGYQGLYNGMTTDDIHKNKQLKKSQQILDYMNSAELLVNIFRVSQTIEKLTKENTSDKNQATQIHHKVGKQLRSLIINLNTLPPESQPTPELSAKSLEKEYFTFQ